MVGRGLNVERMEAGRTLSRLLYLGGDQSVKSNTTDPSER